MNRSKLRITGCAAALALAWGCSDSAEEGITSQPVGMPGQLVNSTPASSSGGALENDGSQATPAPSAPTVAVVPPAGGGVVDGEELIAETGSPPDAEEAAECASSSIGTSLQGLVLVFTFDVSGSMGSYSTPYFAREYKWEPVVAATKAFFSDASSAGVSATLTFFPNDKAPLVGGGGGMAGDACDPVDYSQPDVGMTELPTDAFATAIDAITPLADGDWRQGTPTGPALEGSIAAIEAMRAVDPDEKYVIVLVTDGEPALCSNQLDNVDYVSGIAASVADQIPTYVIGVGNPAVEENMNPPNDGIDNLHAIAAAGGTGTAFLIDTDNPAQTTADFREVIDSIRETSFTCALTIPPPPAGQEFDSTKVNVNYTNAIGETPLTYDPTCTDAFAWYFDDVDNPSTIHMCDSVCDAIKSDTQDEGHVNVEFGCLRRVSGAK